MTNLYSLPTNLPEELTETLAQTESIRIERIISHGHVSSEKFWYDQDENEWVVVLKGRAKVLFEGDDEPTEMGTGEYMNIPAHTRHRVEWTTPEEPTIWLAVFYR